MVDQFTNLEYLIWREPWMGIGPNTFIFSMLEKLGFAQFLPQHDKPYPTLDEQQLGGKNTFHLFSSEPFPFSRHKKWLLEQGFNGAIVDGEVYSWFGIRSFQYLKHYLEII